MVTVRSLRSRANVRRVAIPTYQALTGAVRFLPGDPILCNSLPKSGTHLLIAVLDRVPRVMYSARHHALQDFRGTDGTVRWGDVDSALGKIRSGQYATSHMAAEPELLAILRRRGVRTINVIRDPRDVLVSSAFYIAGLQRHFLHDRFVHDYLTTEGRLVALLDGVPDDDASRGLPPFGERLASYAPWLEQADVLTVRYEELIGPRGGGTSDAQLRAVQEIARHLGRELDPEQILRVTSGAHSTKAATFRSGSTGEWRQHFTPAVQERFDATVAPLLPSFGYDLQP